MNVEERRGCQVWPLGFFKCVHTLKGVKKSEPLSALFVLQNSNFTRKMVMMSLSVEFGKGGVRWESLLVGVLVVKRLAPGSRKKKSPAVAG